MEAEHFGIAVAELQRAGCLTFVHNSGGPVEIVGNDPRLTFDRIEDAAEKIAHAIEDTGTQDQLRALVATRRDCFSTERFCASIREIIAAFPVRRS
jgi:glycosyltransferase involved in cell wall biosynthesis